MAMRDLFALLFSALFLCLISPSSAATNVLYTNQALLTNQYLQYGNYIFGMRADCNLVLLDNGNVVWSTGLSNQGTNCGARLQGDGNFVIFNSNGQPVWASNTTGPSGKYVVILQPNRNVVLYGPSRAETGTAI
ncbi:unnamed protein product [Spirodela intermedia]|uniref:Bulb-type lectin domain-containing protein n=1 Tax=Spirodela intermedia TaxID=51605 RepID=A0A7I8JH10_SPIIN|nr:unnamed protein product [Spirodela intermedia]CAA6669424.1 unnamed protein product [Spirodela intermedia]